MRLLYPGRTVFAFLRQLICVLALALLVTAEGAAQVYVDLNATGANDGTSWADAYTELQVAIQNTNSGEIWVAAGIYIPCTGGFCSEFTSNFDLKNNVEIYGGFDGTETMLSQRDFVVNETILSGDINVQGDSTDNSDFVVYGFNVSSTAVLDGFIIQKGDYDGGFGGAGLYLNSSSPVINNCIFRMNYASAGGAGVSINGFGAGASPAFTNCQFINNIACLSSPWYGGAAVGMQIGVPSSPTFIDCIFENNFSGHQGGAIAAEIFGGSLDAVFNNCQFVNNVSDGGGFVVNGGAMYFEIAANGTNNTIIENCSFVNNTIEVGHGGGISVVNLGGVDAIVLNNCTFSGNHATWGAGNGGGLYYVSAGTGTPIVTDCTLEGSSALQAGGGIYLNAFSNGNIDAVITNTTLTGGMAQSGAGIVCVANSGGTIEVLFDQCTVDGNTATFQGGGVFASQNSDPGSQVTIQVDGGSISNNSSTNGGGGVLCSSFVSDSPMNLNISDCTIDGNTALTGGGIEMRGFSDGTISCSITGSTISNNVATGLRGGGINFNSVFNVPMDAHIANTTFTGNNCPNGSGGGLSLDFLASSFDLEIDECEFISNSAGLQGGGIWIKNPGAPVGLLSIKHCDFISNNSIAEGGAIYDAVSSSGASDFAYYSNCTFNGNASSGSNGGAIYILGTIGSTSGVTIMNGLLLNNSAGGNGGAIYASGAPRLVNSTFYGNAASSGNGIYLDDAAPTIANSIFWNGGDEVTESAGSLTTITNCILQNGYGGNGTATNILTADPLFLDAGSNNFHLTPCSPAIGAGDNASIPADGADVDNDNNTGEQVDIDLDLSARIVNSIVDIGVYEYDGVDGLEIVVDSTQISCFEACDGVASVLASDGTPGYTYAWSNGSTGPTTNNLCSGTYYITVTDNGLCEKVDSVILSEPDSIALSVSADTLTCPGEEVTISASGSGGAGNLSYDWDQGLGNGDMHTVSPDNTTVYTVTVTDAANCSVAESVTVDIHVVQQAEISGDTAFCESTSTQLDAGNYSSYIWSTLETTQTIDVSQAGSFSVTVTDMNSCTSTDEVTVTENPNPLPHISGDTIICSNESVQLISDPYDAYLWSGGETTQSVSISTPGVVSLTVTDENGCTGTDLVEVVQNVSPVPVISGDTSLCNGEMTTLDAGVFDTYEWSTGDLTQTIQTDMNGLYEVTVSDANGCTGADEVTVIIFPEVTPTITGDLSFCEGSGTTLDAGTYSGYQWSNGSITQTIAVTISGSYLVTVTDTNGCTGTDGVVVIENPNPIPPILGDLEFCQGSSSQLSTNVYTTYQWSSGENTQSIIVSNPGTVTITVTDADGCSGSSEETVIENLNPVPDISGDTSICPGAITTLDAGGFDFFEWSTGEGTQTIDVSVSGPVAVTVTDVNGCTGTDATDVTVFPEVVAQITGNLMYCEGSQTTLDAGVFDQYQWSTGENTQTILATNPGTFGVTVTDLNGCTGTDEVTVIENPNPIPIIIGSLEICEGANTMLSVDLFPAYNWSTGETTQSISVTDPGDIFVTVTDANGCSGTDAVQVVVNTNPSTEITGDTALCIGESTILDAGDFDQYLWSTGESTQTVTITSAQTIEVTVTDANGCTGTDQAQVIELPEASPVITGQAFFCEGDQSILDAGVYDSYTWSTGDDSQTISVTASGTYSVTVTDDNGCTGTDDAEVDEIIVSPSITGQLSICTGDMSTLSVGNFNSYQWSTGENTQSIEVTSGGTYSITVSDVNGCTGEDEVFVNESDVLVPQIEGSDILCDGSAIELDAGIFLSYSWSTGENTQLIEVSFSGSYSVTVSDANGCTGEDEIIITDAALPTPEISGDDEFCSGSSAILSVDQYSEYLWSNGETTQNSELFNGGIISVTVTDINGCTGMDDFLLNELPVPEPTISGDLFLCLNESGELTTDPASTYLWSTGDQSQGISISLAGFYSVTVSDENGCTGETSIEVMTSDPPEPQITGSLAFCSGSSTLLDAGNFNTFTWSTGEGTQSIIVNNEGLYSVTVTDANGCTGTDQVEVFEENALQVVIQGDTAACEGEDVVLNPGTFADYSWSTGDNTQTVLVNSSGTYSVTVSDGAGCSGIGEISINFTPGPAPDITGNDEYCQGDSVILDAGGFDSYLWSTGQQTQVITVNTEGNYAVSVTDQNGCTGDDSISIIQHPTPEPQIDGPGLICNEDIATLTVGAFQNYTWSTGDTTQTIEIGMGGSFSITVTDQNGCNGIDDIEIQSGNPQPDIQGQLSICTGAQTILSVSGFSSYQWTGGLTGSQIVVTESGMYGVTVTDLNGCTGTDMVNVIENDQLLPIISGDTVLCEGSAGVLEAGTFDTYAWSTGDTTSSISISSSGQYLVTVSDAGGCTGTDVVQVIIHAPPAPVIDGQLTFCTGSGTTLSTGSYSNYVWSTGDTTQSINVQSGGNYVVTVTDGFGCSGMAEVTTEESPELQVNINGQLSICQGNQTTLDAGAFEAYNWSTGDTTQTITANTAGSYSVTVSDILGCTGSVEVMVEVGTELQVNISGELTVCEGTQTTLDAGQFDDYTWSTGDTTQTISTNTAGLYSVTVSDVSGCTGTAQVNVEVGAEVQVNISGQLSICEGSSTTLDAGQFESYSWSTGDTTQTTLAITPGLYSVTVSDISGCTGTAQVTVDVSAELQVNITGQLSICEGSSTILSAGQFESYSWSTGDTMQTISAVTPGLYSVTVSDISGCTGTAQVTVEVGAELQVNITGQLSICEGSSTLLDAGIFDSYQWSTGENTQTISTGSPGLYSVTVSDAAGCTGTASATVTVNEELDVNIIGEEVLCPGDSITLTTDIAGVVIWSTGESSSEIVITEPGSYNVIVTDVNGCTGQATIAIAEGEMPLAGLDVDQSMICSGDSVQVVLFGEGNLILETALPVINNGNNQFLITPSGTGNVSAIATTGCGSDTLNITIEVFTSPNAYAGEDVVLQEPQPVELNASGGGTYQWSPEESIDCPSCSSTTAIPIETTVYTVTVTDINGCSATDEVTIYVLSELEFEPVNVITPNGDGINENFVIPGIELFPGTELVVFNRWGEPVHESTSYQNDWQGTWKGSPLPAGSYLYHLRVNVFSRLVEIKGTITIIRQ